MPVGWHLLLAPRTCLAQRLGRTAFYMQRPSLVASPRMCTQSSCSEAHGVVIGRDVRGSCTGNDDLFFPGVEGALISVESVGARLSFFQLHSWADMSAQ